MRNGFKTHKIKTWILPDQDGYHFKCCKCGLVHVIEFAAIFRVKRAYVKPLKTKKMRVRRKLPVG